MNITRMDLKDCGVGIVSKDRSFVSASSVEISSCNIGLLACEQRTEFGPARIELFSPEFDNIAVPYVLEANSGLSIDQHEIVGNYKEVYKNVYGKSDTPDYSYYLDPEV